MNICMASDFFFPGTGGVEAHIWHLSHCLLELGHKVIVITHSYPHKRGVEIVGSGLKVYYLPYLLYFKQNIKWPLVFNTFANVRQILLREKINVVHGHSVFSPLAHEVMFHAKTLGLNTVFTDHSLFGEDFGALVHKHIVKLALLQCNHIICVSHVGKQNKALLLEHDGRPIVPISVIPNAVDTAVFTPDSTRRDPNKITIIVNSRLVYRKGIDLLADVLPKICYLDNKIHFIIAGDGPKRILLESAVNRYNLHDRVLLMGTIAHDKVRDVLVRGNIFLNTSRIEAFCMAIVEAASCGLQVVSTNVGGVPEVLPPELIKLTEPTEEGLLVGVKRALADLEANTFVPPIRAHKIIEKRFSWMDVAHKTEKLYYSVLKQKPFTLKDQVTRYNQSSNISGLLFTVLILINRLLLLFFDWYKPASQIGLVKESMPQKFINASKANGTSIQATTAILQRNGNESHCKTAFSYNTGHQKI